MKKKHNESPTFSITINAPEKKFADSLPLLFTANESSYISH